MTFPVYILVGHFRIHPHTFFESLAYVVALVVFLYIRKRQGDELSDDSRWWVITAAVVGAAVGCRLLGWLETAKLAHYTSGKTIVGGLAGGLASVEIVKRRLRIRSATGDLFAVPLILGISVGRIGCFLTGLGDDTYGSATNLPWGIDFGDGIARHPTQLYEIAFLMFLGIALTFFSCQSQPQGDRFKLFMIAYISWRLSIDFLKPEPRILGLTVIQIACALLLLYYAPHVVRIARSIRARTAASER